MMTSKKLTVIARAASLPEAIHPQGTAPAGGLRHAGKPALAMTARRLEVIPSKFIES
jgi:hypothetical protein